MISIFKYLFPAFLVVFLCCASESPSPVEKMEKRTETAAASEESLPPSPTLTEDLNILLGKINPATHPDFVPVGKPYTDKPGMYLHKEAFSDYQKMFLAAKKAGIILKIISSTRTFSQQKAIWEGKWTRFAQEAPDPKQRALKILEYSAMPGASRHHWGTDIDLNDLNNPAFEKGGKFAKLYEWLQAHAHEYGFCQPYTPKDEKRPNGYFEERWHWSYTKVATPLTTKYLQIVKNDMITGFQGAETAGLIDVVENYVGGINTACK
jgi:D-alanyl-D-alanine carboxypeptidase